MKSVNKLVILLIYLVSSIIVIAKPISIAAQPKPVKNYCYPLNGILYLVLYYNMTYRNGRDFPRPNQYGEVEIILERPQDTQRQVNPRVNHRPIRVSGFIYPFGDIGNRRNTPYPISGYLTSGTGLDNGHIGALSNGFPDISENITPQWSRWQRLGDWREMEQSANQRAKDLLKDRNGSSSIYIVIDLIYVSTGVLPPTLQRWSVPSGFRVRMWERNLGDPVVDPDKTDDDPVFDQVLEGEPDEYKDEL